MPKPLAEALTRAFEAQKNVIFEPKSFEEGPKDPGKEPNSFQEEPNSFQEEPNFSQNAEEIEESAPDPSDLLPGSSDPLPDPPDPLQPHRDAFHAELQRVLDAPDPPADIYETSLKLAELSLLADGIPFGPDVRKLRVATYRQLLLNRRK